MTLVQYTECRNRAQTRQIGFTILCLLLSNSDCLLSTDSHFSGETQFEAPFAAERAIFWLCLSTPVFRDVHVWNENFWRQK